MATGAIGFGFSFFGFYFSPTVLTRSTTSGKTIRTLIERRDDEHVFLLPPSHAHTNYAHTHRYRSATCTRGIGLLRGEFGTGSVVCLCVDVSVSRAADKNRASSVRDGHGDVPDAKGQ